MPPQAPAPLQDTTSCPASQDPKHRAGDRSPCCPSSTLVGLAADGSTCYCRACSRVYHAFPLLDADDDVHEWMKAPVPVVHNGSGRSRQRAQMKPGHRKYLEEKRREFRHEQGGFGGRRDRDWEPLSRKLCLPMEESLAERTQAIAATQGVSSQEFIRDCVRDGIARVARQSLRVVFPAL